MSEENKNPCLPAGRQKNFNINDLEEGVLKFWQKNKTFEKSVAKPKTQNLKPKTFVFFDGPPFANGLPHYGHILASIIKDVIPRYKTMRGYRVPRKWGWDCHGLPVEYEIEKELNLKSKKDIEKFGIEKFNQASRQSVLRYADEWRKIIPRIGRWVDMENDYRTMDWNYTESVWWVFSELHKKGLVYEGYKSMHICPRCETTLANFELNQPGAYRDITDISITVKFEILEEKNTFILAWTTTPWTLPGNAALAVNKSIKYQAVSIKGDNNEYIVAKNRAQDVFKDKEYEVKKEIEGKDLIGKKYKPLFDYYTKDNSPAGELKNIENGWSAGWRIYGADFVSIEEGTGIVHIAPAFGEDDMNLGKKYNLPFIQNVSVNGKFKPEIKDFAGMDVKPKENHQSTDIEIIKWLAKENKLFSKQKIVHSYPHCWRCDTPLLNYASASWFVKATDIKKKLIENNKKINWLPGHIKNGRFGKWLEEVRDWAISRSRFWGAPLPVWKCEKCKKIKIIGSIEDIKKNIKKSGNKYFVMRHGGAVHNAKNISSSKIETSRSHPLTKKGEIEVQKSGKELKNKNIDIIFSSDFLRTKQTAEIMAEIIGYKKDKIIFDSRLREVNTGIFDKKSADEYHSYFSSLEEKFYKNPPEGENLTELKNHVAKFLYDTENKYSGKNILIISHEYPIWLMFAAVFGADAKKSAELKKEKGNDFIKTGQMLELDFTPIPHNQNFELDLHRPYIDEIKFQCDCGNELKRVAEVFDCWFESGAMPYGQVHYPFENKKWFENNFPAEFIAEGIDQTRGWFYTLLVLSTALFNKPAYKNVVVNGIILAEDGQKMSKRLKNYPDPMDVVRKYGADALRFYLLASPVVKGENLNFSERGVDEIYKKVILRLWNSYQFYEMYGTSDVPKLTSIFRTSDVQKLNILDRWILMRLNQSIIEITKAMDNYELDKASQPIFDFIDDLSTWYIRRSRERFKTEGLPASRQGKDKNDAIAMTKFVLSEFSKIIAPFTPFISETIFRQLTTNDQRPTMKSVHLENWPIVKKSDVRRRVSDVLLEAMAETRKICSLGLEARQKAGIKVRQPLISLKIKNQKSKIKNNKELLELIKDEINVKEIIFDENISPPAGGDVELDMKITPELKAEGDLRELTRAIQDLRKKAGLTPDKKIVLKIHANVAGKKFIENFENEIKKGVNAVEIKFVEETRLELAEEIKIDELEFKIEIKK